MSHIKNEIESESESESEESGSARDIEALSAGASSKK